MLIRRNPALVLISAILATAGIAEAGERPWPLAIDITLSSSFGEYRPGHLHAGIDIKTGGREGIPCIVVGDGHVSRMKLSPFGYGKAVYVTLNSGETAVYAHVAELMPDLEAELRRAQDAAGSYRVDLYFEPERFPVSEGDIVAYSGRTGTSAAHLHFEFRDRYQNPMNPLSHGWNLPDERAPAIPAIVVIPYGRDARVFGQCESRVVPLTRAATHTYVLTDTLRLYGSIGFGAQIIDRQNGASGRLAPFQVEMTVDGVLFTTIEFERFSYSHSGEVDLSYDMELLREHNQHFLLLFRRTGSTLWNRTYINDGIIDTRLLPQMIGEDKAVHRAVIRAVDRSGNVSIATFPFVIEAPADVRTVTPARRNFFFGDLMNYAGQMGVDVDLLAQRAPENGDGPVYEVEDFADMRALHLSKERYLFPMRAGQVYRERLNDLGAEIVFDEKSLYGDAFVMVAATERPATLDEQPLLPLAQAVYLGPPSLVVKKSIGIAFDIASDESRAGVYRFDERKSLWQFEGGDIVDGLLQVGVGVPGIYAVFADTTPPTVSDPRMTVVTSYATGQKTPEVVIDIEDSGSGVDADRTAVYVNGRKTVARWDGVRGRLHVLLHAATPGTHEVSVLAVDYAGNETALDAAMQVSAVNE